MKLKYIRMGNNLVMHMYNGDTQQYEPLSVEQKIKGNVYLQYENINGNCFYCVYVANPNNQKEPVFIDLFVYQTQAEQCGKETAENLKMEFIGLVQTK